MDNKKLIAIVAVVIIAVAGISAAALMMNDNSSKTNYKQGAYDMLARVNAEGSGIYILESDVQKTVGDIPYRNDTAFYNVTDGKYTITKDNAKAWAGLLMGTPGTTSIQHIQMTTIVTEYLGLQFVNIVNKDGTDASKCVYYNATITNYAAAVETKNNLDGGILWEPQYHMIIDKAERGTSFVSLALTNDLFPGHTCCTIIGSHDYVTKNSDVTTRFLAGYVDSVNYINTALKDTSSTEYANLVAICAKYTTGLKESEIKDSLATITYLYADDKDGSLSKLTTDVKQLTDSLKSLGAITKKCDDTSKFANTFVNDSYLKSAVNYKYTGTEKTKVTVAVIDGDIHQIAIRVGVEMKYFENYGITVETSKGLANGGAVADALIANNANFGFIGAPPATLKTVNGELITV